MPRNSLTDAGSVSLQLRAGYTHKLHAKKPSDESELQFSVSAFNALNHVNFQSYNGVVGSPTFMQPITAADPRRIQLQAQYSF